MIKWMFYFDKEIVITKTLTDQNEDELIKETISGIINKYLPLVDENGTYYVNLDNVKVVTREIVDDPKPENNEPVQENKEAVV